nr:LacI family DNA-binding transcriptional regulator [Chloroflexia bacterium]
MARNRVTLRDVAAAAGVSSGTASNALNGSPLVRPATSSRVLEAARRLNYAPDRRSGRPRQGTTGCIAVAFTSRWPTMTGATFYALVVRGITDVLEEHGYTSRLIRVEDDALLPQARGARRSLTTQEIDGLIVLNWQDSALMNQLCGLGVPLVAVDTSGAYPGVPSVDNDDRGGVASGVAHLIGLGHRRIAFVNSHLAAPFGREALAGY